ncbi:MAG: hypothetical protein IPP13_21570 [Kouleothrix sp.]|jgi:hypothetical protein|nr:hypothetical protein [Kouleothrix sp.]
MNLLTGETREFLNYLHRGGKFAYYWALDEVETFIGRDGQERKKRRSYWFNAGKPARIPQGVTAHIYFGVNPTNERGGSFKRVTNASVASLNCLFAEFDAKDFDSMAATSAHVEALDPRPSIIVSSGGGLHAYWLLDEPYLIDDGNRQKAVKLLYGWVKRVGGDDVKDLARVLRVPGTRNVKSKYGPDFPMVHFTKRDMTCLYAIDELAALVPQQSEPHVVKDSRNNTFDPFITNQRRVQAYLDAAVFNIVSSVQHAMDGQKHFTLRAAACRMGRLVGAGWISEAAAEQLLVNAIHGRARDMSNAVDTIRSGIALGQSSPAQMRDRPQDIERPANSRQADTIVRRHNNTRSTDVIIRARSARGGA